MPIFHKYKTIHVHIPKTAGTTISSSLGLEKDNIHPEHRGQQKHWFWGGNRQLLEKYGMPYQHLNVVQIKEELGEEIYNEYFKFAFVRNPWDRLVSEFYWAKKNTSESYMGSNQQFEDIVKDLENGDIAKYHQRLKTQCSFLKNEQGKIDVDFLGRFENLKEDWIYLSDQLGFPMLHSPDVFCNGMLGFLYNNSNKTTYARVDEEEIAEIPASGQVPAFTWRGFIYKEDGDSFTLKVAFKREDLENGHPDIVNSIPIDFLRKSKDMNVKYYQNIWNIESRVWKRKGYMDEFFNFDLGFGDIEKQRSEEAMDLEDCIAGFERGESGSLVIDAIKFFDSKKGDYKEHYNDWSKEVVGKFYEEDVDTLKYTF